MPTSVARILIKVCAILLFVGLYPAIADDLISNGQFKQHMQPWWSSTPVSGDLRLTDDPAAACLRAGYLVQEKIAVQPLHHYRLSLQVRSQLAPLDSAFVQISFRGDKVDKYWRGVLRMTTPSGPEPAVFVDGGTHEWRPYSIVFDSPQGATELVLYLRKTPGTAGETCYTDTSLSEVNEPATSEADAKHASLTLQYIAAPVASAQGTQELAKLKDLVHTPTPISFELVGNSKPQLGIYVDPRADLVTLSAAAEMARYLTRVTGAAFSPIHGDLAPGEGAMLVIGRDSALGRSLLPASELDSLGEDGFVIRSVGAHILIAGKTSRGTLFGVYWFLDRVIGIKWLAPDATYIPASGHIVIPPLNERQIPRYSYREVLDVEGQDRLWRAHNLMNGESHGPSFSPAPAEIDVFDRSWSAKGGSANFFELLPPQQHQRQHPEWYQGGQLAMMDPAMREALANAVIQRMRQLPDYRSVWFAVHDMDWGWDLDPASRVFAAMHGDQASAPRLDMMIDVANRVRAVLPGARLAFNAYHWSFTPPPGMKVPDYLLVYPMTIQVDYRTGLGEATNLGLAEDLRGWNSVAHNIIVWDHIVNFLGYIQPHPNIRAIGRSIKWLSGLENVRGYFAEGSWETAGSEFSCLRNWLIARLLWNPNEDVQSLLEQYTTLYYGPAGKLILQYIDLAESSVAKSKDRLTEKTSTDLKMFNVDFARNADRLLDSAEGAAAGTVYLERVKRERLAVDYIILLKADEFQREIDASKLDWQLNLETRRVRFWKTIADVRLSKPYQGGDLTALRQMISIKRTAPAIPPFLDGVRSEDVIDFQDTSLFLFGPSRVIADSAASDGAAVRMAPNAAGWNVQFKLDKLPREGSWRLIAAVRSTSVPSPIASSSVLSIGSHPPMNCRRALTANMLTAERYRFVEFPGGPFHFSTNHERIAYLDNMGSTDLLVDRVLAVRNGTLFGHTDVIKDAVLAGCRSEQ